MEFFQPCTNDHHNCRYKKHIIGEKYEIMQTRYEWIVKIRCSENERKTWMRDWRTFTNQRPLAFFRQGSGQTENGESSYIFFAVDSASEQALHAFFDQPEFKDTRPAGLLNELGKLNPDNKKFTALKNKL